MSYRLRIVANQAGQAGDYHGSASSEFPSEQLDGMKAVKDSGPVNMQWEIKSFDMYVNSAVAKERSDDRPSTCTLHYVSKEC